MQFYVLKDNHDRKPLFPIFSRTIIKLNVLSDFTFQVVFFKMGQIIINICSCEFLCIFMCDFLLKLIEDKVSCTDFFEAKRDPQCVNYNCL